MAKKIYDILPPQAEPKKIIKKKDADSGVLPIKMIKLVEQKLPEVKVDVPPKREKVTRKISWKVLVVGIIVLAILIICIYFYFSLQRATVIIWPKTDVLTFSGKVTADKSMNSIDLPNSKIPAQVFESDQDLWQDFPATGTATNSGKASGTIKVYNKLNPVQPFILKSGSHFLSDSGKYFVTSKMVTIPSATFKSGKLVPGSVSAQVTAEEAGKDSNISASKFSVPKLAGTNYYYAIYAESSTSMSGGYSGQVKQVTSADLAGAKDELSKKVLDLALLNIKKKIPQDYVLFDNAVSNNVTEAFSPVKSGAIVDNFNYQVKVKAQAVAFKRADIEKFAKDKLTSNLSNKSILDSSFKIDFTPDSLDISSGKVILNSNFSSRIYQPVAVDELLPIVKEKNSTEIKNILESRLSGQLEKEQVIFWPFWTSTVPSDDAKVKVELKFE